MDRDCPNGKICEAGKCKNQVSCARNSDCPHGEICEAGKCKNQQDCTRDNDCKRKEACVSGKCTSVKGKIVHCASKKQVETGLYHTFISVFPEHGSKIKLVGGKNEWEGNIMVGGKPVCDDGSERYGNAVAQVVCRSF